MDMEKRLRFMVVASIAGIALLVFLSQALQPKIVFVSAITGDMLDEKVSVVGNITAIKDYNNRSFFVMTLKDATGNITVIASTEKNSGLKDSISKNQTYLVNGKVQEYNDTLQISAEKILSLKK